jgi:hypothetical protein
VGLLYYLTVEGWSVNILGKWLAKILTLGSTGEQKKGRGGEGKGIIEVPK